MLFQWHRVPSCLIWLKTEDEPGYSALSSGGLVAAEDAGDTYPQGTVQHTEKNRGFMVLATQKVYQISHVIPAGLQRNLQRPCHRPPMPEHTWLGSTSQILQSTRIKDSFSANKFRWSVCTWFSEGGHTQSCRCWNHIRIWIWMYLDLTARLRGDSPACTRTPVLVRRPAKSDR